MFLAVTTLNCRTQRFTAKFASYVGFYGLMWQFVEIRQVRQGVSTIGFREVL
jgi:hypothetical protein